MRGFKEVADQLVLLGVPLIVEDFCLGKNKHGGPVGNVGGMPVPVH